MHVVGCFANQPQKAEIYHRSDASSHIATIFMCRMIMV